MLKCGDLELARTSADEKMLVAGDEYVPLPQAQKLLRKLFLEKQKVFLNGAQIQVLIEYLEIHPVTNQGIHLYLGSNIIIADVLKQWFCGLKQAIVIYNQ